MIKGSILGNNLSADNQPAEEERDPGEQGSADAGARSGPVLFWLDLSRSLQLCEPLLWAPAAEAACLCQRPRVRAACDAEPKRPPSTISSVNANEWRDTGLQYA
ncbi:hypothetical protein NDU88_006333 [Pleurodeles waltl]|uniref:Uncharacterized protein n=1 Tax=Pleurodeles waltl TaxID=8319 RepID=A0AAV7N3R1_PLEWA|nr:hypothetical protein NDU88_006333 [Pleurodeles waltl]